jgi:hypothetical protein
MPDLTLDGRYSTPTPIYDWHDTSPSLLNKHSSELENYSGLRHGSGASKNQHLLGRRSVCGDDTLPVVIQLVRGLPQQSDFINTQGSWPVSLPLAQSSYLSFRMILVCVATDRFAWAMRVYLRARRHGLTPKLLLFCAAMSAFIGFLCWICPQHKLSFSTLAGYFLAFSIIHAVFCVEVQDTNAAIVS